MSLHAPQPMKTAIFGGVSAWFFSGGMILRRQAHHPLGCCVWDADGE
jgi:hypothetical protein